jgi:tetratricopeptide (TPR) repeat protein
MLDAVSAIPEVLSLSAHLSYWNSEQTADDYEEKSVYRTLRDYLKEARTHAPLTLLADSERAAGALTEGIIPPPLLVRQLAAVTSLMEPNTGATPAEVSAAVQGLTESIDQANDIAVKAVLQSFRADLFRAALPRLNADQIKQVDDDYRQASEGFNYYSFPLWSARALNKRGNHCQTYQIGDLEKSLRAAVGYHSDALRLFSECGFDAERGDVLHNLGNDLTKLHAICGSVRDEAVNRYREALTIRTRVRNRHAFAETSHGLGRALSMPTGETFRGLNGPPVEALDAAIEAHREALSALEAGDKSPLYSAVQHDLGVALLERARGHGDNGIETLTQAIHALKRAVQTRSPKADPAEYATTQNALGVAYMLLDTPNSLREAEACFRDALSFRPMHQQADFFSDSSDNLGVVLLVRASGEQDVRAALDYFSQALRMRARVGRPFGHAQTLVHFGQAYEALVRFDVPQAKETSENYFSEAADILHMLNPGVERQALLERMRRHRPADLIW